MAKSVISNSKIYFPNLDGLRFVAFLMVYLQHGFFNSFKTLDIKGTFYEKLIDLFCNGGIGVSIFFVLSGFLITYLILVESNLNGKLNIGYFYIRRTLRIWPLYFAVVIFVFLLYPYFKSLYGIGENIYNRPAYYFFFLSNFDVINIQNHYAGLDSLSGNVTWSVAIEEQFYIIWPLLFYLIPKRYYKFIFISTIFISLLFRYLYSNDSVMLYFHSLGVCADLAIGGLAAYCILYFKDFKQLFERLNKPTIICMYILTFVWLYFVTNASNIHYFTVYSRLISTVFFVFIILEQNYSVNSFYKFSSNKFFTFWGKYTYGLYLLHPIAITIIDITLRKFHFSYKTCFLSSFIIGIFGLIFTMLLSYVSYHFFEIKFLKIKEKFNASKKNLTKSLTI